MGQVETINRERRREKREQGRKTGRCSGSEVRQPPDRQTDTDETGK